MDGDPQQLCHKLQCYFDAEKSSEIDRFPFLVNVLQDLTTKISYEITLQDFLQIMDDFITCIEDEALQCSNKPGRAMHLAKTIIDMLYIFKNIAQNHFGEVMTHEYFSRSGKMLTTYVDMELKASVKAKIDHASIANQIATNIDSHLPVSEESEILDVFINMSRLISIHKDILLKLFQKYLYRPIVLKNRELDDDSVIKYVILFKIWKNIETNATEKRRITDWCVSFVKPNKSFWQNKRLKLLLGKDPLTHNSNQLVAYMCTKVSTSELRKYTRLQKPTLGQDNDSDIEEISVELGATTVSPPVEGNPLEQLIDICDIKLEKPTIVDSIDLTEDETPKLPLDETRILVKHKWLTNLCQKSSEMQPNKFFVPDSAAETTVIEIVDEEQTLVDSVTMDKSVRAMKTYERVRNNSGSCSSILNSIDRSNDSVSDGESEEPVGLFSSLTNIDKITSPEHHKRITDEIINDWEANSTMDEDDGDCDALQTGSTSMTAPRTAITVSLPLQFINDRKLLVKSPRKAFRSKGGVSFASEKPTSISTEVFLKKSNLKSSNGLKSSSFSFPVKFPEANPRPPLVAAVRFSEDTTCAATVGQQMSADNLKRRDTTYPVLPNYHYQPRKLPTYLDMLKKPTILEKKTYINLPRFSSSNGFLATRTSSHMAHTESHRYEPHTKLSYTTHQKDHAVAQFSSKYNRYIEDSDSDEDSNHTQLIYNNTCQALVRPKTIDNKTFKASVQLLDILQVIEQTRKDDGVVTSEVNNKSFRRSERNRARAFVKFDDIYLDNRLFEPNFKGKLERKVDSTRRRGVKRKSHFEEFGKSLTDVESECENERRVVARDNLTDVELENSIVEAKKPTANRRRKRGRSMWTYRSRDQRRKYQKKLQEINLKPVVVEQDVQEYPRAFSTRKKVNSFSDSNTISTINHSIGEPTLDADIVTDFGVIDKPIKVYKRVSKPPNNVSPPQQIGQLLDPNVTVKIVLTKCDSAGRQNTNRNARSLERIAPRPSPISCNRRFCSAENLAAPQKERRRLSLFDRTVDRCPVDREDQPQSKILIMTVNKEDETPLTREPSLSVIEKPNEPSSDIANDAWDDLVNKPLSVLDRSDQSDSSLMGNHSLIQPEDHTLMVTALLNAAEGVKTDVPKSQASQEPIPVPNTHIESISMPTAKKNRRKNKSPKLDPISTNEPQVDDNELDSSPINLSITGQVKTSLRDRRCSKYEQSIEQSLKSRKILQVNKFVRRMAKNVSTDDEAPTTTEPLPGINKPKTSEVDIRKSKIFLEREMHILDFPAQKVKLKHKLKEPLGDRTLADDQKVSSPTVDTTEEVETTPHRIRAKKGNRKRKPTKIFETQVPETEQTSPLLPLQSPELIDDRPEESISGPDNEGEVKLDEESIVDSSTTELLMSPTTKQQQDLIKPGNSRKILLVHKFRKMPKSLDAALEEFQPTEHTIATVSDCQNESESSDFQEVRTPIGKKVPSEVDNADFLECKVENYPLKLEDASQEMIPETTENPDKSMEQIVEEVILPKRVKRMEKKRKMFLPKRRRKLLKPVEVVTDTEEVLTREPDKEEVPVEIEEPMCEGGIEQQVSETSEMSLEFSEISGPVSESHSCDDAEPDRKEHVDAVEEKGIEFCKKLEEQLPESTETEPKLEKKHDEALPCEQKSSEDADESESETSTCGNANESGSENFTVMENFPVTEEVSLDSDEIFIERRAAAPVNDDDEKKNVETCGQTVQKKIQKKFSRHFLAKRRFFNKSARNEKPLTEIDKIKLMNKLGKSRQRRTPELETEQFSLEKIDSTTTKEEPLVENKAAIDESAKVTTESLLPQTSTDHTNINTNFDSMFMDCLTSNQKDIINDNPLAFDMPAASTKQECEDEDEDNTHQLNEVLNTSHPRSEEEEEIRANKYFDGMSNNLNNTALIDSTISLCNEYENHQKEVDSPLYMDGVDLITTHTSTTETDEEEAAALNNDTHVETTMNQIYDILTNEKEETAAVSAPENDSSVQITSTLMEEATTGGSETAKKPLQQQQQQPDFDIEIPRNAIFDQSLLQKLIDKSVLITPVNSGASSSYTSTFSSDVSSTIKSPKNDHNDSSFVCKADSTNPVAKVKRTYTRKRLTKRPPKIDVSLQHKLPTRPVNHLEPVCLPSSSSASPKSETKTHQQMFGSFVNPQPAAPQRPPPQHAGTAIVLAPVTHNKTSVKLVQYISNAANVVGNAKPVCTISNNLIGKHNFLMQPQNYTITTNNKPYANHNFEHDSNSSTSSSSSVNLEQQQQHQLNRINSSDHVSIANRPKPMSMPAQFYIINKKTSPTTTTSKSAPMPAVYSPPPTMQAHNRKAIIHSIQVMNAPVTPQNLNVSVQSAAPKKRGRPKGSKNKMTAIVELNNKTSDAVSAILNKKKRALKPQTLLTLQQQQQIQHANKLYNNSKRKVHEPLNFGTVDDEEINMCSYIRTIQTTQQLSLHSSTTTSTATVGGQQHHFNEPASTIHQQLLTNRGHDLLSSVAAASNNDEQLTPPEIMQPPMQQNLIIDYTTNLCHGGDTFIDSLNDIESASVHSYHDDDFVMIDNNR